MKYCRKVGTNEIYIQTAYLMARGDMEECQGPTQMDEKPDTQEDAPDRVAKIKTAIQTIDVADYAKPAYGRPAMPKVGAVTDLVGFKVTATEILEAME